MPNQLYKLLGLKEDASETEALARVTDLGIITDKLSKLAGVSNVEEALGVFHAWQKDAAQVAALSQENATLKAEKCKLGIEKRVDALIDSAHLAPAEREEMVALGVEHPAAFDVMEKRLSKSAPIVTPGKDKAKPATGAGSAVIDVEIVIDDETRAELARQKVSEADFLKTQKFINDRDRAAGRLGR